MPITKLPFDTTELFRVAAHKNILQLTMLDIRLGVEQIVDTDEYFEEAQAYWAQSGLAPEITEQQADMFRACSMHTFAMTNFEIREGMAALLDDETFKQFCHDRWVRLERLPADDVLVDLGAMPDGV